MTVMLTRLETQQVLCIDPTFFLGLLVFKNIENNSIKQMLNSLVV